MGYIYIYIQINYKSMIYDIYYIYYHIHDITVWCVYMYIYIQYKSMMNDICMIHDTGLSVDTSVYV